MSRMVEEEGETTLATALEESYVKLMAPILDIYKGAMEMRQEFYDAIFLSKERKRIISKNYRIIRRLPKNIRGKAR